MSLLRDEELADLVRNNFVRGLPMPDLNPAAADTKDSPIQAASIDLHIGDILLPDSTDGPGSVLQPLPEHVLPTGGTAVVVTQEELSLPANLAAIGFPPSRVSFRGLPMTNPGHVDPGYEGRMRFAVINMGKAEFVLRRGDPIVTLLFIQLPHAARAGWRARGNVPRPLPDQTTVNRLSADFLDVTSRATQISKTTADDAVRRGGINIGLTLGTIAALIAVLGAIVTGSVNSDLQGKLKDFQMTQAKETGALRTDHDALRKDFDRLKADAELQAIKARLDSIEKKLPH